MIDHDHTLEGNAIQRMSMAIQRETKICVAKKKFSLLNQDFDPYSFDDLRYLCL